MATKTTVEEPGTEVATSLPRVNRRGQLLVDGKNSLQKIVRLAQKHFPGISEEEIYVEPEYRVPDEENVLSIFTFSASKFQKSSEDGTASCKLYSRVSLADVLRQVKAYTHPEFGAITINLGKVHLFGLDYHELSLVIDKQ